MPDYPLNIFSPSPYHETQDSSLKFFLPGKCDHERFQGSFVQTEYASERQIISVRAVFNQSFCSNLLREKYSPVAGTIENDDTEPIAAARREIQEETQLIDGRDIELEFCGLPFSFEDAAAGRSWTVYPFGWTLKADDSSIKLDWEHSGWDWFDPQTILNGSINDQCVPRISNSLKRVYFGPNGMFPGGGRLVDRNNTAGKIFLKTLETLKTDTENGARVLATAALQGLLEILECFAGSPSQGTESQACWLALRIAAYHLVYSSRPSMNAAIRATILAALSSVFSQMDTRIPQLQPALTTLRSVITQREHTLDSLARAFEDHIRSIIDPSTELFKIITLSASSSILAALKRLSTSRFESQKLTISLTILESRPRCEGAHVAADLVSFIESALPSLPDQKTLPKMEITIIPDTHLTLAFAESIGSENLIPTIVLLGTDHITPSGHIVNKTGSQALAELAFSQLNREASRTIVLGETDKIAIPKRDSFWSYFWALAADDDTVGNTGDNTNSERDKVRLLESLSQAELRVRPHEQHEAEEVYAAWDKESRDVLIPYIENQKRSSVTVTVENTYFEFVEAKLIDEYITENGKLTVEEIMKFSVESFRLEERMFKNLYD